MRTFLVLTVGLFVVGCGSGGQEGASTAPASGAGAGTQKTRDVEQVRSVDPNPSRARGEAVSVLREEVLSRRLMAALPPGAPGAVRGTVMDWGVSGGLVTLVALDDGTVSLYLNPGGGTIGAGRHAKVARAARAFRTEAEKARSAFVVAEAFPPPGADSVAFYLLTDSATLRAGPVSTAAVQVTGHPLAGAGEAAQALLTELQRVP